MGLKGSTSGKGSKLIVRAIDVGFGNTKFVDQHDHGADIVCSLIPSVAPQTSAGPDLSGGVIQRLNTVTVEVDGLSYEVGKDARLAQDSTYGRILDSAYPESAQYLALIRGALFYMRQDVIDMLVVGLPVNTIDTYHDILMQRLVGEHPVPVMIRGKDELWVPTNETKTVMVKKVKVKAQPVGAFFDYSIRNKLYNDMRTQMNLIIDPGFFTLDWVVAKGIKVLRARSDALPGGMSAILKAMAESIGSKIDAQITDVAVLDDAIRFGKQPKFYGKPFDMTEDIRIGKEKARQFVNVLANKVGNNGLDIDNIVLAGGGAAFFYDVIQEKFTKHKIVIAEDPVFSNVRGFQLAGEAWAKKAEFQGQVD